MERVDTVKRFCERAEFYASHRPAYPPAVFDDLIRNGPIPPGAVVADIGSGTGIFAQPLLARGYEIYCVEPNAEMRAKAEALLGGYGGFHSVAGSAEDSTLAGESVDIIVSATAFHWFDAVRAGAEFRRILRSPGLAVLAWNTRLVEASPFARDYEEFVRRWSKDYDQRWGGKDNPFGDPDLLFGPRAYCERRYPNSQTLTLQGLQGRWLSTSYAPLPGAQGFQEMIADLEALFQRHQSEGAVEMIYETRVYWGRLR